VGGEPGGRSRRGVSLSRWRDVWSRFQGRGVYPPELAFLLTSPLRRLVHAPETLLRALELAPDARVLEIGPGPGYYSVAVARQVARGRLQLLDVQRGMLAKARARLARAGVQNAAFAQGHAARLPFRDGCFDAVFLVAVLGEVGDPVACLREVRRCLRPGGLCSVTELPGDPDAMSEEQIQALSREAGLVMDAVAPLRRGFTCNLRRPPGDPARADPGS
jgi:uncharacterized protein